MYDTLIERPLTQSQRRCRAQLSANQTQAISFAIRQQLVNHQNNSVLWLGDYNIKNGNTVKILASSLIQQYRWYCTSFQLSGLQLSYSCIASHMQVPDSRSHGHHRIWLGDILARILQLIAVQHIRI